MKKATRKSVEETFSCLKVCRKGLDEMLMIFPLDFPYFEQAAILFIRVVKCGLE